MQWLWTWSGKSFGYIVDGCLRTHFGKHVGNLQGQEIYDKNGKYLGEIMSEKFLITNQSKKSWTGYSFTPHSDTTGYTPYSDYTGYTMYSGYEDFPHPTSFTR